MEKFKFGSANTLLIISMAVAAIGVFVGALGVLFDEPIGRYAVFSPAISLGAIFLQAVILFRQAYDAQIINDRLNELELIRRGTKGGD